MGGAGRCDGRVRPQLGGYGKDVKLPAGFAEWKQKLVTDPQTSGGLLVACAPDMVERVLAEFRKDGFAEARRIGEMTAAPAQVTSSSAGALSRWRSRPHTSRRSPESSSSRCAGVPPRRGRGDRERDEHPARPRGGSRSAHRERARRLGRRACGADHADSTRSRCAPGSSAGRSRSRCCVRSRYGAADRRVRRCVHRGQPVVRARDDLRRGAGRVQRLLLVFLREILIASANLRIGPH